MFNYFAAMNSFVKTGSSLAIVGLLGFGLFKGYEMVNAKDSALKKLRQKEELLIAKDRELKKQAEQIDGLQEEIKVKDEEIKRLDLALGFLKVNHRVAQIVVLDQVPSENGRLLTKFSFVEVDKEGKPLDDAHTITIEGDVAYVDSWVVKFQDAFVEAGSEKEPLRSTSVCLFRRIFGEFQNPSDGYVLDPIGFRPTAYSRGSEMSELERDVWENFWDYANDPERQAKSGVRNVQGEAPSIKLEQGKLYKLMLRASGGLSIKVENLPAAVRGNAL